MNKLNFQLDSAAKLCGEGWGWSGEKPGDSASDTDVAQGVAHENSLDKVITDAIRSNRKITRAQIAEMAGVSMKTIERRLKTIQGIRYVGRGSNGHWEISDPQE